MQAALHRKTQKYGWMKKKNTKSTASRLREVIVFIHSTLMRPHLEYCIYLSGPQYKKDLEEIHRRVMKMIRELEQLS